MGAPIPRCGGQSRSEPARGRALQRRTETLVLGHGDDDRAAPGERHRHMAAVVRAVVLDRPHARGGAHPCARGIRAHRRRHCAHLCRDLDQGDAQRHDARHRDAHLGQTSSSRLVSRGEQGHEMTKINVIQPGTIEAPPGEITFLLLPERNAFQARATRLSALAEGHALADYLRFLAALARAQHEAMSVFREVPLPGPEEIERCREHGLPTLGTMGWLRDPMWHEALRCVLPYLEAGALAEATRATIARAKNSDADW